MPDVAALQEPRRDTLAWDRYSMAQRVIAQWEPEPMPDGWRPRPDEGREVPPWWAVFMRGRRA